MLTTITCSFISNLYKKIYKAKIMSEKLGQKEIKGQVFLATTPKSSKRQYAYH